MEAGAKVVLTSRDLPRAQAAAKELGAEAGMQLDLSSLSSVRGFAARYLSQYPQLHILIHNAGAVYPRRTETEDGLDAQLAIIYLGPFLLTALLLERMKASAPARLISVASDLHRNVELDFEDLQSAKKYHFLSSYSRAELAKVMLSHQLARRLDPEQVAVACLHPGGVRSKLFRNFRGPLGWLIGLSNLLKKSPAAGAKTSVHLATAELIEHGGYYVSCRPRRSSASSYDEASWQRLQEASCKLLGVEWDALF